MADYADARRRAEEDLLHVIEWLESGHWMACQPLFADDGAKAREKGQRLRALLAAEAPLRAAAREALTVLTRLADSAHRWAGSDVPVGLVAEIDSAKARLAGVLG